MIDIDKYKDLPLQGTNDWHVLRLGKFNASRLSELMTSSRKKDEVFGQTALSYIKEVFAETYVLYDVVSNDNLLYQFISLTTSENKYMRYGSEHEYEARDIYVKKHDTEVVEVSSIAHPTIQRYACSSDGLVPANNCGIEIKWPLPKTYMDYMLNITDNDTLKAIKPEYFWQMMAQMDICELDYMDFVTYCPFLEIPYNEVKIVRDDEAINQIHERINKANEIIDDWAWKLQERSNI